jgi:CRP-like cAMP-binding protein
MQELISYLQSFKRFTSREIELIKSRIALRTLQKNDYFPESGFILKGILRIFYHNNKGDEVTEYFIDENNFVMELEDNTQPIPASEYRQAVMKSDVAVFSIGAMDQLSSAIPGWDQLVAEVMTAALTDQAERIKPTMAGDATACYKDFLDKYPQIASRIPLSYLASYLGITQQSLSRIRKQLAKNTHGRK